MMTFLKEPRKSLLPMKFLLQQCLAASSTKAYLGILLVRESEKGKEKRKKKKKTNIF
jgi:hypothetical protein